MCAGIAKAAPLESVVSTPVAKTEDRWSAEADAAANDIVGCWALANDVDVESKRNRATLTYVRRLVKIAFLRGAACAVDAISGA